MDSSALASAESWLSFIATAKLIAAFLVAIGVAMEFAGDWASRPFDKIVSDARELKIVELNNETARLRKQLAGRMIDSEIFPKLMAGQPSTHVTILFLRDDPESSRFATSLYANLKLKAGWEPDLPLAISAPRDPRFANVPLLIPYGGNTSGVAIVANRPPTPEEMAVISTPADAAISGAGVTPYSVLTRALALAMGDTGPSRDVVPGFSGDVPPDTLRIVVGPKPVIFAQQTETATGGAK